MKLTGKCKKDFEYYYFEKDSREEYPISVEISGDLIEGVQAFNFLPSSMKWGVLVDFFIEKGIYLEVPFYWGAKFWAYEISKKVENIENNTQLIYREEGFNNVQEARAKAVEEANEMYNQKFKK